MEKEEFYIGWQGKAPRSFSRQSKSFVFLMILLVIGVASAYVLNQKGFNNSTTELGSVSEVKGVLYRYPVPMLKVKTGENAFQNLLLCGFGKDDALATLDALEAKVDNLEAYEVTLKTSLFYYDGHTILEVPFSKNNMAAYQKLENPLPKRTVEKIGEVSLKGQIVDSKCYLGVMKPGYGKIHRSCGVRCISGGIPALLVTNNGKGAQDYFILVGPDGEMINQKILDKVGFGVKVKGQLEKVDEWYVLKVDPKKDIQDHYLSARDALYLTE
ncbi:MAG: hypothetical protein AAFU64_04290 [Bacteroidota bacterium]